MLDKANPLLSSLFSYQAVRFASIAAIVLNAVRSLKDQWFWSRKRKIDAGLDYAVCTHDALGATTRALFMANTVKSLYYGTDNPLEKVTGLFMIAKEALRGGLYHVADDKKNAPLLTGSEEAVKVHAKP